MPIGPISKMDMPNNMCVAMVVNTSYISLKSRFTQAIYHNKVNILIKWATAGADVTESTSIF